MLKKYIYVFIIVSGLYNNVINTESIDVPSAHDLQKVLHESCNKKIDYIKQVDKKNIFNTIFKLYNRIKELEEHYGIKQNHDEQEKIIHLFCNTEHHPTRCALSEKFEKYDQKRLEHCTTKKCEIMKLYNQLNNHIHALATLLNPYTKEIIELNEAIHDAKTKLNYYYDIKDGFTLDQHMLLCII